MRVFCFIYVHDGTNCQLSRSISQPVQSLKTARSAPSHNAASYYKIPCHASIAVQYRPNSPSILHSNGHYVHTLSLSIISMHACVGLDVLVVHPFDIQVSLSSVLSELIDVLVLHNGIENRPHHGIRISSSYKFDGASAHTESLQHCCGERTTDHHSVPASGSNVGMARVVLPV